MSGAQATLAYILKGYPRISETFISNEILLLEKHGFRLRLFPMRKAREPFCHDSVKQIKAPVDYLPTELLLDLPRLIGPNIIWAARFPKRYRRALATATRRYRRTRKIATFKHLFQAGYLAQQHLDRDPSIVHLHGHFAHSPTSVTMFAAQLTGLPFSFTAHAKDIYTSHPDQLSEKIAAAQFVATCTKLNQDHLLRLNRNQSTPLHCIYHGIDLSMFNDKADKAVVNPPYRLLTVARMTEKKGLPTVYQSLKVLADRQIPFSHVLIGDGDDRETILELIKRLGLAEHCSWLGTRTHAEVLDEFRRADLFLLGSEVASNGDRDGIPNVIVESLAMGVPTVATNVSAIPEILINEQTGLTVDQRDSTALATAVIRLLTEVELRRRLIDAGREFVRNNFDNTKLIGQLAKIFQETNPRLYPIGKAA